MVALLREQGGLTRSLVDTIKNLATIVEVLAGAVFRAAVINAATTLQGKGNIFQRLDDTADLFVGAGYADLAGRRRRRDLAAFAGSLGGTARVHARTLKNPC